LIVQPITEEAMNVSRRDFAFTSAFALGASGLLLSASASGQASAADEAAVKQGIETLRQGTFSADKAKLEQVMVAQVSWGHSDGRVENREQLINGTTNRKQTVKSLTFPDLTVAVVGNAAIARHIYLSESELDGKQSTTRIGAIQLWQKQDGAWKLIARQGFRLPATA
jgi:ketosteroid isomerase-like protein